MPDPIAWRPSVHWDGNDGHWNTFLVSVGQPVQSFRVLPSTSGQETWVPGPQGCIAASSDPAYCGFLRGAQPVNGLNSSGFQQNASTSWNLVGTYSLGATEEALNYSANGLYGYDTVTMQNVSLGANLSLAHRVVANVPDLFQYWLGAFGLGPQSTNFSNFNDAAPSFFGGLNDQLPSLSWSYTAGAYYEQAPGSLVFGGYDASRLQSSSMMRFPMYPETGMPFKVAVQKVIAESTVSTGSAINLLPVPGYYQIDSTISHLWLPDDAIKAFVNNFGLTYDNKTDLFLINSTMRQKMLTLNPTVTLFLANTTSSQAPAQGIKLPYAAFDLQASYPFYQNATYYFPIRRAVNDSQYFIGRMFFQEATLIADFDRRNFTIAQASYDKSAQPSIVTINRPSPAATASGIAAEHNAGMSSGAIAGIAIGAVVAGLAVAGLIIWYLMIRRKGRKAGSELFQPTEEKTEFPEQKQELMKADISSVSELPDHRSTARELAAPEQAFEAEGDHGRFRGRPGMVEVLADVSRR